MTEKRMLSTVYALSDPRTSEIRYVGQTRRPQRRFWLHCSRSNNRSGRLLSRWLRGLFDAGLKPTMAVLERTTEPDEAEVRWIADLRSAGAHLLNMNEGGCSMEQCYRAPGSPTKGKKTSPLHQARKDLAQTAHMFRAEGNVSAAERVERRCHDVDVAIARLIKQVGKPKALSIINERMKQRRLAFLKCIQETSVC